MTSDALHDSRELVDLLRDLPLGAIVDVSSHRFTRRGLGRYPWTRDTCGRISHAALAALMRYHAHTITV